MGSCFNKSQVEFRNGSSWVWGFGFDFIVFCIQQGNINTILLSSLQRGKLTDPANRKIGGPKTQFCLYGCGTVHVKDGLDQRNLGNSNPFKMICASYYIWTAFHKLSKILIIKTLIAHPLCTRQSIKYLHKLFCLILLILL